MTGPRTVSAAATITPLLVAELLVEGERMPVYVHLVDHADGRILVDTGMIDLHPLLADMDPILTPLTEHPLDLESIDAVVATHLHADHCGGNRLFAGIPIHVQRLELADALQTPDYTISEWVGADGVDYIEHDGDAELLPGVRIRACPGHTRGSQILVVDSEDGPIVVAGDSAVWHGQLDHPVDEGPRRILALDPSEVWLAHAREPWRPDPVSHQRSR